MPIEIDGPYLSQDSMSLSGDLNLRPREYEVVFYLPESDVHWLASVQLDVGKAYDGVEVSEI